MGTPAWHKKPVLDKTDNIPARNEFITKTLAWPGQHPEPVT